MADEKNLNNEEEKEALVTEETVAEAVEAEETAEDVEAVEAEETAEDVEAVEAEETAEAVEAVEAVEAEETAETVETVEAEETAEADGEEDYEEVEPMSEIDIAVAQALAARDAQDAEAKARRNKILKVVAIIAAAVIVVGGIVLSGFVSKDATGGMQFNTYGGWLPKLVNKYNRGYVDVTGTTLGDVASSMGVEVADFLEEFELPEDMPASTYEMVIIYTLPSRVYCEMYGSTFESIKELIGIPDKAEDGEEITEETPWGIALGEATVGKYVNDAGDGKALAEFKEQYGFGDEVTADTKWKEVRNTVDEGNRQNRLNRSKPTKEPKATEAPKKEEDKKDDAKPTEAAKSEKAE